MRVSCTYVRVRLPNAKRGEGNWGYQLLHLAMVSASILCRLPHIGGTSATAPPPRAVDFLISSDHSHT